MIALSPANHNDYLRTVFLYNTLNKNTHKQTQTYLCVLLFVPAALRRSSPEGVWQLHAPCPGRSQAWLPALPHPPVRAAVLSAPPGGPGGLCGHGGGQEIPADGQWSPHISGFLSCMRNVSVYMLACLCGSVKCVCTSCLFSSVRDVCVCALACSVQWEMSVCAHSLVLFSERCLCQGLFRSGKTGKVGGKQKTFSNR